jgi:hypothetical protein
MSNVNLRPNVRTSLLASTLSLPLPKPRTAQVSSQSAPVSTSHNNGNLQAFMPHRVPKELRSVDNVENAISRSDGYTVNAVGPANGYERQVNSNGQRIYSKQARNGVEGSIDWAIDPKKQVVSKAVELDGRTFMVNLSFKDNGRTLVIRSGSNPVETTLPLTVRTAFNEPYARAYVGNQTLDAFLKDTRVF